MKLLEMLEYGQYFLNLKSNNLATQVTQAQPNCDMEMETRIAYSNLPQMFLYLFCSHSHILNQYQYTKLDE